ncbi:hypothetical protein A2459_04650 [Candidatus Roizmanbacteria bacterium RIFOXYC2_FULL_41_10]|nr:MAG: hypothetical protein A2459_04650 [Candidatus Roizmanbacteria bacterium RIFOXYC2_FULL_41_10]
MGIVLNRVADFASDKTTFLQQLKSRLTETLWQEPAVIVEALIEPDSSKFGGSPNVELFINETGQVDFSYPCEQILEQGKKFIGVYIHPELLKSPQMQAAKQAGMALGKVLSDKGYRGCFDIDMVVDKEGRAFAVEANLRRTGGTHLHELAEALLGEGYWDKYYLMSLDLKLKQALSYQELKAKIEPLMLKPGQTKGIVIVNPDMLSEKILVPAIFGNSHDEVTSYSEALKKALGGFLN